MITFMMKRDNSLNTALLEESVDDRGNFHKNEKLANEYFRALDLSYILSMSDLHGNITYVNENLLDITKYTREELIGKPHSILRHPSVSKEVFKNLWQTIKSKKNWSGTLQNRAKNGESYYVNMTIMPILNEDNHIEQFIAIRYDITEYIYQQERLKQSAYMSNMTELPNLKALVRDIDSLYDSPYLAIFNIDGFKVLNNLYGYNVGNEIINALSLEIQKMLVLHMGRYNVYHIHADEFAILASEEALIPFLDSIGSIQKKINDNELLVAGNLINLQVSVACSDESKSRILECCNMAMHFSRSQQKKFVYYDESIDFSKDYEANIYWSSILRQAIKEGMITPYFQPIYDIGSHTIDKYEALMRIVYKDEVYTPYQFMNIAKKVNLYADISIMMLERVFDWIVKYPYEISINLTFEDILNRHYVEKLFELLRLERKGKVILEIVESEGIDNYDDMNLFIKRAKLLGCKIAIDDFGTGYSNFEYLLKLNADFIKIDGSLIKNIDVDFDSEVIVRTIVTFAKIKQIPIVAEFVSNENILTKIKEMGIEFAQGYYIGEPAPLLKSRINDL